MVHKIERKELYDLVWTKPMKKIQEDFGLSYTQLRSICEEYKIPLPENGYWTKIAFNKDVTILPLLDYPGIPAVINLHKPNEIPESGVIHIPLVKKKIADELGEKVQVPKLIKNWHPLVARFRDKHVIYQNEIKTKHWSHALDGELGIHVKESHLARATKIFDTVIKALEIRGHKVFVDALGTHTTIGQQTYQLSIRTKNKRIIDDERSSMYQYTKLIPQDILIFKIFRIYSFEFADTVNKTLEDKVDAIIARLELMAKNDTKIMEDARRQNEIYQAQREQREAIIQAQHQEKAKFERLVQDAENWNKAILINKYIDEMERKHPLTQDEQDYIAWGRKRAEILNPLKKTSFNL